MAEQKKDPAVAWREMLGEWEKTLNAFANKAMDSKEFAQVMGTATNAGTTAQGAFSEAIQRYLASLNLPSRAELTNIGERMQAIEAQLNGIAKMVQSIPGVQAQAASGPKPARTRQPPSAAASGGSDAAATKSSEREASGARDSGGKDAGTGAGAAKTARTARGGGKGATTGASDDASTGAAVSAAKTAESAS